MYFLLIIVATLMILMFLKKKTGKIEIILPSIEDNDEEDFIELPNEKAYYDETNQEIINMKKKIDQTGIRDEDIKEIKLLKERMTEGYKNWENVQVQLKNMIKERTTFVSQGNFYPREYAYDINRMRTEKEKAREFQLSNPLKSLEKINTFIKEQTNKVVLYKDIKDKVEKTLVKLEIYEKGLKTKKESVPYFTKKQQLFLHLQNGELKEARKILKDFKTKIKNIK